MIKADLKSSAWGHLLQILYSLRVSNASLTPEDTIELEKVLDLVIRKGSPEVVREAEVVKGIVLPEPAVEAPPKKTGAPRGRKRKQEKKVVPEEPENFIMTSLLSDTNTYEPPHAEKQDKPVWIEIPIYSWGIKYHPKECILYATGANALFILHSNSLVTAPSEEYRLSFRHPRLLFEICTSVYRISQNLAQEDIPISYPTMLDQIWQEHRSNDVIVIEEDLIANYAVLQREMNELDDLHEFAANINLFGMNNFISTLEENMRIWKEKNTKRNSIYQIKVDMEMAASRSEHLWDDQVIAEKVAGGQFPCVSSGVYPQAEMVTDLSGQDLR